MVTSSSPLRTIQRTLTDATQDQYTISTWKLDEKGLPSQTATKMHVIQKAT